MCMKKLNQLFNKKIKKVDLWTFVVIKLCLIIFGIVLGSFMPDFVQKYLWYWIGSFVILYVWLLYKLFKN